MRSGQALFWGYDFGYIPIELVSAVYDRFLGERVEERRSQGAYYTPMFLADLIVLQLWEALSDRIKRSGRFLDPACGSGIFLVFEHFNEHARIGARKIEPTAYHGRRSASCLIVCMAGTRMATRFVSPYSPSM